MGKNRNKQAQKETITVTTVTKQQGDPMSQSHDQKQEELNAAFNGPSINPEATGTKPDPKAPDADAKKGGVIELITSIPKSIYNKGLLPAFNFCKGVATRAWGSCVNMYNAEVAMFKELGASRYLLGRVGKLAVKTLKIVALVTVASFLNSLLINATGISLFSPTSLMVIAFVALIAIVVKSYLDQKDMGAKFSIAQTGAHIVDTMVAA